jgi:ABC-type lipoprotein release transport system permease subunit
LNTLQAIWQSVRKQGVRPVLIILQLFVGFTALAFGIGMVESTNGFIERAKGIASVDIVQNQVYPDESNTSPFTQAKTPGVTTQSLQSFYEFVQHSPMVQSAGTYLGSILSVDELRGIPKLSDQVNSIDQGMEHNGRVPFTFLDAQFLTQQQIEVTAGRSISAQDISPSPKDEIPVLVGAKIAEHQPLGSTLSIQLPEYRTMTAVPKKLKVVGVLPKGFVFWRSGSRDLSQAVVQDDAMVVAPMQAEQEVGEALKTRVTESMQIHLKSMQDFQAFQASYIAKLNELGMNGYLLTMQDQIDYYKTANRVPMLFSIFFALLMLSMSAFGLLGVILAMTVRRQREFGIRYALGATPSHLAMLVGGEVLLLILCGAVLGTAAAIGLSKMLPETSIEIGPMTCLAVLISVLVIGLISALLPVLRTAKLEPITLIRGERS